MKTLTKVLSLVMAVALLCGLCSFAVAEEQPTLKILNNYLSFDPNEDPIGKLVQEVTGIKVEFYLLPQTDADQHLLMEIAGGADYDIVFHGSLSGWGEMMNQKAVMDITDLLKEGGENILAADTDMAWSTVTDEDGRIWGMPYEAQVPAHHDDNAYGQLRTGIGFRSDMLEELGMEVPHTLDDLLKVYRAYKEKTGNIPLTVQNTPWLNDIMSAFNMSNAVVWYDLDGAYTPLLKHPELVNYLKFMQDMYSEGLLDADFAINTSNARMEKFTNGTALSTTVGFWDIPGLKTSLELSNPNAKVLISNLLGNGTEEKVPLYIGKGINYITWIPRTAKNPELAIKYLNILADLDTAKRVYIGEEGVSFTETEEGFYPIFPAFSEYMNSDKYIAMLNPTYGSQWWQARARKTAEMAEAFDYMNARIGEYEMVPYYTSYAASLPEVQEYQSTLNQMVTDAMLKAIVTGEDAQTAIDNIIKDWDSQGGAELEEAMQKFYDENKDLFVF